MIVSLKVTLLRGLYSNGPWEANIEIDELANFDDLHVAIQHAVRFDADHSYSFYTGRTERSRDREYFHDDEAEVYDRAIKDWFPLPPRQNLYYLFDWRHEWIFRITKNRKSPYEPVSRRKYPRVESTTGVRPDQYGGAREY